MTDLTIFIGNTLAPIVAGIVGVTVGAVILISVLAFAIEIFIERG